MSEAGNLRLLDYLQHIRDAILRIGRYVNGLDETRFIADDKTQDAVIRNLEIIGEAVKNISNTAKKKHKNIAWNDWAKVRDKLIHHYFGVNLDIVWNILEDFLPDLLQQVNNITKKS